MQADFSEQIRALEDILKKDSAEATIKYKQQLTCAYKQGKIWGSFRNPEAVVDEQVFCRAFVKKDSPAYLTKGDHQLVLRLNKGWVAKAANYFEWEDFYRIKTASPPDPRDTLEVLKKEFGFDIPMITVEFEYKGDNLTLRIDKEGTGDFMIVPDLTEGGKYIVKDIEAEEDFTQFLNGDTLRKNLGRYITRLVELYGQYSGGKVDGWNAELHGHIEKEGNPEGAIRRMFFLKIDPNTQHGEIVPGDFNHVFFYKEGK